jgi:hypothetical protein
MPGRRPVNSVVNRFHVPLFPLFRFHLKIPENCPNNRDHRGGGGAGSGPEGPSLFHLLACSIPGVLHQLSNVLGGTVGVGLGGSAGAGAWSQGFAISGDIQLIATPDKSLALVGSFSATMPFSGVVFGVGASGGVQASYSNAQNLSEVAGPSLSINGGGGWVEGGSGNLQLGLAHNSSGQLTGGTNGVITVTGTGGVAAGAEGTVASLSQTGVLAATSSKDVW